MSDGFGCQCMARSASECCCAHVDWRSEREVELEDENERLKAELAEAKKDAERYRWLRDNLYTQDGCLEISIDIKAHDAPNKSDIDYAIDSAKRGN